jgi:hypothetical protein
MKVKTVLDLAPDYKDASDLETIIDTIYDREVKAAITRRKELSGSPKPKPRGDSLNARVAAATYGVRN